MKMKPIRILMTLMVVLLLGGCATFNKTAVTLTEAEDAVMKEWATLHNDHRTTSELDLKVMMAHADFKHACEVAAAFLRSYAAGGTTKETYVSALEAARASIGPVIALIEPLLKQGKVASLESKTMKAATP